MEVVITGGAGYVGSVLTESLLGAGMKVRVLDTLSYTAIGLLPLLHKPNLTLIKGDIRDPAALEQAFTGADAIIHLAAIANDPSGELDPGLTYDINLAPYASLLMAASQYGVKRFINASTFSVYGFETEPGITETHPLRPQKAYSIAKAGAEAIVNSHNGPNLTTTNLRLATVCGWSPRMRFDLIVNAMTGIALDTGVLDVWGGEQQRPQIHIYDLVDCFMRTLKADADAIGGETINVGGENASIKAIAEAVAKVIGGVELRFKPPRDDERSYDVNWEKAHRILGFTPNRTIAHAVEDILLAHHQGGFVSYKDPIFHNLRRMKELGLRASAGA